MLNFLLQRMEIVFEGQIDLTHIPAAFDDFAPQPLALAPVQPFPEQPPYQCTSIAGSDHVLESIQGGARQAVSSLQ
jgi:hypothetical protein